MGPSHERTRTYEFERAERILVNIEDLRKAAQRRLPRVVFDYIDGAADGEVTLRRNVGDFDSVIFHPRNAIANAPCNLRTTVLGMPIDVPFMLAPVGFTRLFYPRGECVAAHEAGKAGTIQILSTLSGSSMEDVRTATSGPTWFQLYLLGGRDASMAAIARAQAAGYSALVVTIDTAVSGMRERDVRNGAKQLFGKALLPKLPYLPQILAKPHWLAGFISDGMPLTFPNVVLPDGPMGCEDVAAALEQSTVTWSDLDWIREIWKGPIVVKGVMVPDDARRAVDAGANAIVVSNHGARQLDGVSSTIAALPEIVAAVGGKTEIYLDGGIRRGGDIVKALCLGARAVLCGRAYAYGLGAYGPSGVARAIEILRNDIVRTLRLLGVHDVASLDRSYVSISGRGAGPGSAER